MISFELAKKLKDEGFPQNETFHFYLMEDGNYTKDSKEGVFVPSLSELIEACGGKQNKEGESFVLWFGETEWHAGYTNYLSDDYIDDYFGQGSGSTPEEALASLYLSINKK